MKLLPAHGSSYLFLLCSKKKKKIPAPGPNGRVICVKTIHTLTAGLATGDPGCQ